MQNNIDQSFHLVNKEQVYTETANTFNPSKIVNPGWHCLSIAKSYLFETLQVANNNLLLFIIYY